MSLEKLDSWQSIVRCISSWSGRVAPFSRSVLSQIARGFEVSLRLFQTLLVNGGNFFLALSRIRGHLALALIGAAALCLPQQVIEIYRVLGLDFGINPYPALVGLFSVAAATLIFWHLCRIDILGGNNLPFRFQRLAIWKRVIPLCIAILIPLSCSFGLYRAASNVYDIPYPVLDKVPELKAVIVLLESGRTQLYAGAVTCLIIALIVLVIDILVNRSSQSFRRVRYRWVSTVLLMALAVQFILLALYPLTTSRMVGVIPVFLEFLIAIVLVFRLFIAKLDSYGWPSISLIVALCIAISVLQLNDDHIVQTGKSSIQRPYIEDAFKKWYLSRGDRDAYTSGGYPVFIVSAAGGGLYAASHASRVLARLQDQCPNFAQHVFAISGVSGGSLGATLFSSLTKTFAKNQKHVPCNLLQSGVPGPLERKSIEFMSRDFLTPLLAATLFPDFAQRFIPYPIPRFDRARVLEATIADAWSSVAGDPRAAQGNPFSKPYLAHWDPTGPAPALVLNTTDVNKGHRVAQAPFTLVDGLGGGESGLSSTFWLTLENDFYSVTGLGGFETSRDISLASAVALSARFPWITPAGTFSDEQTFVRLVDGGYFENSGAEAAVDLLKRLAKPVYPDKNWPKIRVFLLMITAARSDPDDRSIWNGLGELLSPIRAFMNTRERRGNLAISRAIDDYNKNALVLLNLDDFSLPLGWQLSAASQAVIGEHSGRADRQINTDGIADERAATLLLTLQENNDAACSVLTFLSPNYKPNGDACVRNATDGKRKLAR